MFDLFECAPLSAKISRVQCKSNRARRDDSKTGSFSIPACRGCAGLGAAVVVNTEGFVMPESVAVGKTLCSVVGCDKQAQHGKDGMCKACFTKSTRPAVVAAVVAPLPVVSEVERVAVDALDVQAEVLSDMRTALVRTFESGATRSGGDKPEYAGYLSPRVLEAFGRYMFEHQVQPDGKIRDCRNWQHGIPAESYMQSMFRHFIEVWTVYENGRGDAVYAAEYEQEMITSLMALFFNVQGMAHELIGTGR